MCPRTRDAHLTCMSRACVLARQWLLDVSIVGSRYPARCDLCCNEIGSMGSSRRKKAALDNAEFSRRVAEQLDRLTARVPTKTKRTARGKPSKPKLAKR